jgi:hypothetical protein
LWRLRHNTARPDILAADETQPVEPLCVGESDAGVEFARHATPSAEELTVLFLF